MQFLRTAALHYPSATVSTFKNVLSTITSPVFAKVTIIYQEPDFPIEFHPRSLKQPTFSSGKCWAKCHLSVLAMLYKVRKVREFRLELCADVWANVREGAIQQLELEAKGAEGWSESISSQPLVTYCSRGFLPAPGEQQRWAPGWLLPWAPR